MVSIDDYIEQLTTGQESDDLEFKTAKGGFPGSFWETYSAFANTNSGTIILGVVENASGLILQGIDDSMVEKYKKEFWSTVNNRNKISVNILTNNDVQETEYDGHKFLVFFIPRAKREQRPVFCGTNPEHGTYKRNNEGDYKCTADEVRRMYTDAAPILAKDDEILECFSWNDLDSDTLKQYRKQMSIAFPDHPWLLDDDLTLMTHLGGYRKDRRSGIEGITLAGMLMFGKTESIQDRYCCPHYMVDYREVPEDDRETRWEDRVCPDGTWEANLFQFYNRVMPKLMKTIPNRFRLKGDIRVEDSTTHEALREAFVNFCVHACYTTQSPLVITKRKDAIIFSNPGTLLISQRQYYEGGESVCRNPSLQRMFQMLGRAEKAGSGASKIQLGWREANWRKPIISEKQRPDKVELLMPLESLLSEQTKASLVKLFGDNKLNELDHNELNVLALAITTGKVTNESLRQVVDLHKADITQMLKKLCRNGLLIASGLGRGTHYSTPKDDKVATLNGKVATFDIRKETNNQMELFDDKGNAVVPNVSIKVATSDEKVATSDEKALSERKRLKKEILQKEIILFCSTWKSLSEIASHVGKNYNYLRNKVIPEMVKDGYLIPHYPDKKNHPDQKYRINK